MLKIKTMKKIGLLLIASFFAIACQNEKSGFVDTEKLLKEYQEMIDTKTRFTAQNDKITAELDLKIKGYQIKEDLFRKNANSMSSKKRQEKYNELQAEAQSIQQEQQSKIGGLQVESQAAIDSLITKVKKKVRDYGAANGYTYIYGSNDAGSVLYGKDNLDLTNTILQELNEAYEAKKEQ